MRFGLSGRRSAAGYPYESCASRLCIVPVQFTPRWLKRLSIIASGAVVTKKERKAEREREKKTGDFGEVGPLSECAEKYPHGPSMCQCYSLSDVHWF